MLRLAHTLILIVFLRINNFTISIHVNLFLCLEFYSKFKLTIWAILFTILIDRPTAYVCKPFLTTFQLHLIQT